MAKKRIPPVEVGASVDASGRAVDVEFVGELTDEQLIEAAIAELEGQKAAERQQLDAINSLASKLSRLALEQVSKRRNIEERWKEDTQQYNGQYDADTMARLNLNPSRSKAFLKITRAKTNAAEARLGDMLFPTDDRNWMIQPTPMPTLAKASTDMRPAVGPDGQVVMGPNGQPVTVADQAKRDMEAAKEAAEGMQREIDDQLNEANYPLKARTVIHDACVLGTGVFKGPIVVNRTRKSFTKGPGGKWVLKAVKDHRPAVERVNPWDFFPDMTPLKFEDSEFVFERSWPTKAKMREYLENDTYIRENVREVLNRAPMDYYLQDTALHQIRDGEVTDRGRYEMWEYHGPIDTEALLSAGLEADIADMYPDAVLSLEEAESRGLDMSDGIHLDADLIPDEISGCVVFCCGIVVKMYLNPLNSGDIPYSVMIFEPDETSVFGYGVPYLMRDTQRVINSAWRMELDNAGLSAGPQVVFNKAYVTPSDGTWGLAPMKLWEVDDKDIDIAKVFGVFPIDARMGEIDALREAAMRLADEETNLPLIAQGNQNSNITRTAQGMSMLMNAANVVLRRSVKLYDDGITKPLLTRFYHYNMQYSDNEAIKGDFEVDARGASVLLAKEIESQNLMQLAFNFAAHPVFGPLIKPAPLLRRVVKSLSISQDDVVKSDMEMKQEQAAAAQNPQQAQPSPEQIKAQSQMELAAYNRETLMMEMEARERIAMMELRAKGLISAAEMQQQLEIANRRAQSAEVMQAREMKFSAVQGQGI